MNTQWLRKRITGHMLWEYPDLAVISLGVFVVFLGLGTIWPVLTIYMQGQGISVSQIGTTTAAWMAANFLFQIPMGWASDRIGRKPLLLAGLAVHGILSLAYMQAHDLPMFLLIRFIEGIGSAAMLPAARAHLMDSIPPARRGQAFGILGAAFNGGILLGPAIGGLMVGVTGMQGPFWFGAGSSLVAFGFLAIRLRDRRNTQMAAEQEAAEAAGLSQDRVHWRTVLPVFLSTIGWGFVGGFFNVIWNVWMHDLGAGLEIIGFSYTLFALPLIILGPWAGRLADRRNRVLLILIPSLVAAAIYFAYGFLTSIPIILTLGVLEGAMIGILSPASDSYMADVLPSNVRGKLQGMITSSNTAAGFVSALIVGPLYQMGPFYLFITLASVNLITAALASLLMLPTERRLRGKGTGRPPQRQPEPAPGLSRAEAA
jgi:MFS family permease